MAEKRFYLALRGQDKDADVEDALWQLADVLTGEGMIYGENMLDLEGFVREKRYMWVGDQIQALKKKRPVSTEEEKELEEEFRQEYGKLPVYEFTIRKIGYTDDDDQATFEEDPFQARTIQLEVPQAKELFPDLSKTIDELVTVHGERVWFDTSWEFDYGYGTLHAWHLVGESSLGSGQERAYGFRIRGAWEYDCTRIHALDFDCNEWKFSPKHGSMVKYLAEENSPEKVKQLYKKLRLISSKK